MPPTRRNRLIDQVGSSNPFELTGASPQLIAELARVGDSQLVTAIKGMRGVISRAFHPDVSGGKQSDYYIDSLTAYDHLVGMSPDERTTLASAYSKRRGGANRRPPKAEHESRDLRDGRIVRDIAMMVARSEQSIPSAHNTLSLIRPLDFARDPSGQIPLSETPPASTLIHEVTVDEQGKVHTGRLLQNRFTMLARHRHQTPDPRLEKAYLQKKSDQMWAVMSSALEDNPVSDKASKIYLHLQEESLSIRTDNKPGLSATVSVDPGDSLRDFSSGYYSFSRYSTDSKPTLDDVFYQHDPLSSDHEESDLLIVGVVDNEYLKVATERIYGDRPTASSLALPTAHPTTVGLSRHPIPDNYVRILEKSFSPMFDMPLPSIDSDSSKTAYAVATDKDGLLFMVGSIIRVETTGPHSIRS